MNYSKRFTNKPSLNLQASAQSTLSYFDRKYSLFLTLTITGMILLFLGPFYFYLNQNYDIFINLAYDVKPQLVQQLNREQHMLKYILTAIIMTVGLITYLVSNSKIKKIISPLIAVERHMKQLIKGNWNIDEVGIHRYEEHKQLLRTYEYFYKILKSDLEQDIQILEKVKVPEENRESHAAIKFLLQSKIDRLGKTTSNDDSSVESSESAPQRHAS